jgi:hypothetical protein
LSSTTTCNGQSTLKEIRYFHSIIDILLADISCMHTFTDSIPKISTFPDGLNCGIVHNCIRLSIAAAEVSTMSNLIPHSSAYNFANEETNK